jgi:hypothetical protein
LTYTSQFMHQNSPWRLVLAIAILLPFAAIGIAHVAKPDSFIKRSGLRKGGEMLSDSNRLQTQIAGAIFAAFAGYVGYSLLSDYFSH